MKYLILFFALASNLQAQEIHNAYLPFEKINLNAESLQLNAEVMPPSLIDKQKFVEHIQNDCANFKETLNRYQVDQLNAEDLTELLTLPLGYSMKKTYQVRINFVKSHVEKLNEAAQIKLNGLAVSKLNISLNENSLTGKTQSLLLAAESPELSEQAGSYEVKFNSRDQLCDFIDNKLVLKLKFNTFVQSLVENDLKSNLQLWAQSLNEILKSNQEPSERLKAIEVGFKMQEFYEQNKNLIPEEFVNYDYLWNLLFKNESSFEKTNLWNLAPPLINLKQFFQQQPQDIKIKLQNSFTEAFGGQENPYAYFQFLKQSVIAVTPYFDRSEACSRIPYNYFAEMKQFDDLKKQISPDLTASRLEELKNAIATVVQHLNQLAAPELNSENYKLRLEWHLPLEPQRKIKKYEFRDVNYLGQFNPEVVRLFAKASKKDYTRSGWVHEDSYFHMVTPNQTYLKLEKNATLLEICQFLPTLRIELQLQLQDSTFVPEILNYNQNILLEVK